MAKANKAPADGATDVPGNDGGAEQLDGGAEGAGEIEQDGAAEQPPGAVAPPPTASGLVRALVLRACGYGEAGTVVELDAGEAATGVAQGALDDHEAAVAAAGA